MLLVETEALDWKKQTPGSEILVKNGWVTNARIMRKQKRENNLQAEELENVVS